ncbi:MAG: AraC family transcriptional regulator [Clostridiales bacterium]|jgi:AraC-like DNA-binding protein|nr:AraC family transcriptional regulator [Clostridiales bacterium]
MENVENPKQRNLYFESDSHKIGRVLWVYPRFLNVGKQESDIKYDYKAHIQDEYEFIYMLSGSVEYRCGGSERFRANAGDMYFVRPGQLHEEHSLVEPVAFIYLKFFLYDYKGNRMDDFVQDPRLQLFTEPSPSIGEAFKRAFREMSDKKTGFKQIIDNGIMELLIYVIRERQLTNTKNTDNSSINSVISMILEDITVNVGANYSVEGIADQYGISKSTLHHSFKAVTGLPFKEYVNRMKVQEAEYHLATSDRSVQFISEELGFSNAYYFSALFKKRTGHTPTAYRKLMSEKRAGASA